ncbi:hypothetical protein B0H17DRAFT_1084810 [Mycena rosella]|uniref:Uncharacterized protein n=1 Tax=Mycena rosella TaxID=1033263 RepID=A0AAD7D082_MYCRO|nr:hypothetical protein B0H17DRAFT_1084810 [Mycena rosella]
MVDINEDVFSQILSHVCDSKNLYTILVALPKSHLLFPVALARLWELPVYLDSYDPRAAVASQKVLDYLLDTSGPRLLAESIRHLDVSIEHKDLDSQRRRMRGPPVLDRTASGFRLPGDVLALYERLPELFKRTVNLESLDYHSRPGIAMESKHVEPLQHLERLRRFAVNCALRDREVDIPAGAGPGELSAQYDAENWQIEPFFSTVGPLIISLDLRNINQTMFAALTGQTDVFTSYHTLEHLKLDITEGVWDWNGGGSPAMGASPDFKFPCLGFPSVKRFELIVCDKTLQESQKGPLDLVHCNLLTELSIIVRHSIFWMAYETLKLFEALSPLDLPALSHLEIKDSTRNTERHYWSSTDNQLGWKREGRVYFGLVPSFLGSIRAGGLPNLTSLWVDERILVLPHRCAVRDLLDPESDEETYIIWTQSLRAAFGQLESLRVGFGPINHTDAGRILDLCDPAKLSQFGFEWNWHDYARDEEISAGLLAHLARFPKLNDIHILFPRPETQLSGRPDPVVDARTLSDVTSIFKCNGNICRVGIGNSVVWERDPSQGASAILFVSDGSTAPNAAVSKFFHAGYMPKYFPGGVLPRLDASNPDSDNFIPPRPVRGEEIEQLRDLLQRIVA